VGENKTKVDGKYFLFVFIGTGRLVCRLLVNILSPMQV